MQIQPLLSTFPLAPTVAPRAGTRGSRSELSEAGTSQSHATEDSVEISDEASAAVSQLEPEEQEPVEELKQRDRDVRALEQAHVAAAGPYALSGPTYEYHQGPDGNRYAVGGEVQIDTSPVEGDPEATIEKARVVRAAALAPANPSVQDHAVAAAATQMESKARTEVTRKKYEENEEGEPSETLSSTDSDIEVEEIGLSFNAFA